MAWIEKPDGNRYWFPETLPESTDSYNTQQLGKSYLTKDNTVRVHPGWKYDNGAVLDDEYLLYNEEWKLIIDNYPDSTGKVVIKNPTNDWITSDDGSTVTITYKVYTIISKIDESADNIQQIYVLPQEEWIYDDIDMTVEKQYNVSYYTDSELESVKLTTLRLERAKMLAQCDWVVVKSMETGVGISTDILEYRQTLRDLPENINLNSHSLSDIKTHKMFPNKPLSLI